MIILDSSIVIEIERGNEDILSILRDIHAKHPNNISITSAVYAELLEGFLRKRLKPIKELENFSIVDFDKTAAEILARTKLYLESKGRTIPIFDLVTASCAIANNAVLITKDNHFRYIPELKKLFI